MNLRRTSDECHISDDMTSCTRDNCWKGWFSPHIFRIPQLTPQIPTPQEANYIILVIFGCCLTSAVVLFVTYKCDQIMICCWASKSSSSTSARCHRMGCVQCLNTGSAHFLAIFYIKDTNIYCRGLPPIASILLEHAFFEACCRQIKCFVRLKVPPNKYSTWPVTLPR